MAMQGRLRVCVSAERVLPRKEGVGGPATWKGGTALHTPLGTKTRESGQAGYGHGN